MMRSDDTQLMLGSCPSGSKRSIALEKTRNCRGAGRHRSPWRSRVFEFEFRSWMTAKPC